MEEISEYTFNQIEVMVVDDEIEDINIIFRMLKKENFLLTSALSAIEALKLIKIRKPDLLLLDIKMPILGGFEACRLLRLDPITADLPIIFISGLDNQKDKEKGLAVGANDYITKPFHEDQVLLQVKRVLNII